MTSTFRVYETATRLRSSHAYKEVLSSINQFSSYQSCAMASLHVLWYLSLLVSLSISLYLSIKLLPKFSSYNTSSMGFVHKCITIPRFASCHIHNGLVSFFQRPFLDPRFNILLDREFKHFLRCGEQFSRATRLIPNLTSISCGAPMLLPPSFTPLAMREKALKGGIGSSGAPTWMKVPLMRNNWRYFSKGISLEETVLIIRSSEVAWCVAQSESSLVAMNRSAPIFCASAFLVLERLIATTSSAPRAFT